MSEERGHAAQSLDRAVLISAFLDGMASEEERKEIEGLLASDPAFQEELAGLRAVKELLAVYRASLPSAPPSVIDTILEEIEVVRLERVMEYVDGVLSPRDAAHFETRLANDAELAGEVQSYLSLRRLISETYQRPREDFCARVMERIAVTDIVAAVADEGSVTPGHAGFMTVLINLMRHVVRLATNRYVLGVATGTCLVLVGVWFFVLRTNHDSPPVGAGMSRIPAAPSSQAMGNERESFVPKHLTGAYPDGDALTGSDSGFNTPGGLQALVTAAWSDVLGLAEELRRTARSGTGESGRQDPPVHLRRAVAPFAEAAAGRSEETLSAHDILTAGDYIGRFLSWKGEGNRLHCAVVVDLEVGRETVRLLCQRYKVNFLRADQSNEDDGQHAPEPEAGELVVLTLPREKADALIRDMSEQFASLAKTGDREAVPTEALHVAGRPDSPGQKATTEPEPGTEHDERLRQQVTPADNAVAVSLSPSRVRFLRDLIEDFGRIEHSPYRDLLTRLRVRLWGPLSAAWGESSATGKPGDRELAERGTSTDRVRVFLYLIDSKSDRIPDSPPHRND